MEMNILTNQATIIDTIKVILYKNHPIFLEKLNFEDDNTFLEPLLFVYLNNKNSFGPKALKEILQGYFSEKKTLKVDISYNKEGIAYLPRIGYFHKGETKPFQNIAIIEGTTIEVLFYPTPYLEPILKIVEKTILITIKLR